MPKQICARDGLSQLLGCQAALKQTTTTCGHTSRSEKREDGTLDYATRSGYLSAGRSYALDVCLR